LKALAIYGAGGFGREMALMIDQINKQTPAWRMVGFYDDGIEKESLVDGWPILGGIEDLNRAGTLSLCIAIADPAIRQRVQQKISNSLISFPTLIHPTCLTGSSANQIGQGSILTAGVILTVGIAIGDFCIVNLGSTIGHDVKLDDYCSIMPGCSISGNVTLGKRCIMGTGSRIIQGISIGEDCMIGAGALVTKSFQSGKKIMGVPARAI
jgi:sugar O-acyltransferase (sialic acid O-acetyltransferase NeuD family)